MLENTTYQDFCEKHKNIAIEIQNLLTGMSIAEAIEILNAVNYSIKVDSNVKGFGLKP